MPAPNDNAEVNDILIKEALLRAADWCEHQTGDFAQFFTPKNAANVIRAMAGVPNGTICSRCGVGINTTGTGNCATCATYSDAEVATWERGDKPTALSVTETAHLIERNSLCFGFCDRKPKWVTFTDISALRFSRRSDAIRFIEAFREQLDLENVFVTEHLWTGEKG